MDKKAYIFDIETRPGYLEVDVIRELSDEWEENMKSFTFPCSNDLGLTPSGGKIGYSRKTLNIGGKEFIDVDVIGEDDNGVWVAVPFWAESLFVDKDRVIYQTKEENE